MDKKDALEKLDLILLCMDEIVDGKVVSNNVDGRAPLYEQTISQALATAREQLTRFILK